MDPKEFIRSEWAVLKSSKTFKGLVAMEVAAVSLFVEQVVEGVQTLDLYSLRSWLALQGALAVAFLFRQAWAGIETQLDGQVPPEVLRRIEGRVQDRAVQLLSRDHPEAARALQAALRGKEGAEL